MTVCQPPEESTFLVVPELDAELRERGVVVTPFLDSDEVAYLLESYSKLVPAPDAELVIDYLRADRSVMYGINELLAPVWRRRLPELFTDGRPVLTTLVVKHPGPDSYMYLHDDRSYVDEAVHRSATLWIPLVDVSPELGNGCLEIVPHSHRLPTGMSGTGTPDQIRPFEAPLRELLESVSTPAGSAVVYDSRLLHASGPNTSDAPRLAIVCAVAPRSAQLIHIAATGRRRRNVHAIDESFFLDHDPRSLEAGIPTSYPVISTFDDATVVDGIGIARALGLNRALPRSVCVPPDVAATAMLPGPTASAEPPGIRSAVVPVRENDLVLESTDLEDAPWDESVITSVRTSGGVGHATLVKGFRRVGRPPDGIEAESIFDSPRGTRAVTLVLVDRAGRLEFTVPDTPLWSRCVQVIECPSVGAGMAVAGVGAVGFDLGMTVELAPGARTTLWNDGPGTLALTLATSLTVDARSTFDRLRGRPKARPVRTYTQRP